MLMWCWIAERSDARSQSPNSTTSHHKSHNHASIVVSTNGTQHHSKSITHTNSLTRAQPPSNLFSNPLDCMQSVANSPIGASRTFCECEKKPTPWPLWCSHCRPSLPTWSMQQRTCMKRSSKTSHYHIASSSSHDGWMRWEAGNRHRPEHAF